MDINGLTLLPPDPVEWDAALEAAKAAGEKKAFKLAPKGIYTLLRQGPAKKGATAEGYLQFEFPALVIQDDGPYKGQEIRFTKVNTKRWPDRPSSSLADYILATGHTGGVRTNEEYEALIEALALHPVRARCNWRTYCKVCRTVPYKGMEAYPVDVATGEYISAPLCPECAKTGVQTRTFANLEVKAFLAG